MKIVNEKGKLFGVINLVDLLVLLIIVAVIAVMAKSLLQDTVTEAVSLMTKAHLHKEHMCS